MTAPYRDATCGRSLRKQALLEESRRLERELAGIDARLGSTSVRILLDHCGLARRCIGLQARRAPPGAERVRPCDACGEPLYDVSGLGRTEEERFLQASLPRPHPRSLLRRLDGRLVASECRRAPRAWEAQTVSIAVVVVSLALSIAWLLFTRSS